MKFKMFPVLMILCIGFSSCTKEKIIDLRDDFVGQYKGTSSFSLPVLSMNSTDNVNFSITKSSSNSSQIIIDNQIANVSSNTYTYVEFTETINNPTYGTVVMIFNGKGTYLGGTIYENGTVKVVIAGTTFTGTWSSKSTKL